MCNLKMDQLFVSMHTAVDAVTGLDSCGSGCIYTCTSECGCKFLFFNCIVINEWPLKTKIHFEISFSLVMIAANYI